MISHVRFVNARLWRTKLTSLSTFTTTHLWLSSQVENYQKKSRLIKLVIFCMVISRNFTIISSYRRALEALVHEELPSICLLCNSGGLIFFRLIFQLSSSNITTLLLCTNNYLHERMRQNWNMISVLKKTSKKRQHQLVLIYWIWILAISLLLFPFCFSVLFSLCLFTYIYFN